MHKLKAIQGLLAVSGMIVVIALSASCQEAPPMEVAQLPPTASLTIPAETPSPTAAAAAETKRVATTATALVQKTATPVAPTQTPSPPTMGAEAAWAAAAGDLAQRLEVPSQDVVVHSVEAVEWSDSSLGCPQPGMMYAQVVTPGYRVLLEVDGQLYEIHTDTGGAVVLCEQEDAVMVIPPVSSTVEPGLEPLIALATKDLAQRLSIAEGEIEVLEAIAVVWPNASLGCPQPGMSYRQIPMDGALIRLRVEGKVYEYHSGGGQDPFLCEQPLNLQKDSPPAIDLFQLTPGSPDE